MFKRPKEDVLNNAIHRTLEEENVMLVNFRCDSADAAIRPPRDLNESSQEQEKVWRRKKPPQKQLSPRLMTGIVLPPEITNEFKPMIERKNVKGLPPVYNHEKTEMQKKYTIDVYTKILKMRKDYTPQIEQSSRGNSPSAGLTERTASTPKQFSTTTSQLPAGHENKILRLRAAKPPLAGLPPKAQVVVQSASKPALEVRDDALLKIPVARTLSNSKSQGVLLKSKVRVGSAEKLRREFLS
jgi:hypothetical protein